MTLESRFAATKGIFAIGPNEEAGHVERVGFEPRVVILWWAGTATEGVARGNRGGIGFWSVEAPSGCVAWASEDGASPARTSRCAEEAALLGVEGGGVSMRGDLALARGGFSVRWATPPATQWTVHYLALGGSALSNSTIGWFDSLEGDGLQRVGGLGFRPKLVALAPVGVESLSTPAAGLSAAIGAASASGQAGASFVSRDGVDAGEVGGAQRDDAAVVAASDRHAFDALGRLLLVDSDGFTVEWAQVWPSPRRVLYLALAVVRCQVGTDHSATEPGRRRTRSIGFRPEALLFFSWGLASRSEPTDIGRLCLGGASPGASGCAGWDDRDDDARPTTTHSCSSASDVLVVTNTQTGGIHAAASLTSIDARGFTLDWTRSDGHAREFAYVALAAPRRRWRRG